MDKFCFSCQKLISPQWVEIQKELLDKIDISTYTNKAFMDRCLLCYLDLIKLFDKDNDKMLKLINKE